MVRVGLHSQQGTVPQGGQVIHKGDQALKTHKQEGGGGSDGAWQWQDRASGSNNAAESKWDYPSPHTQALPGGWS